MAPHDTIRIGATEPPHAGTETVLTLSLRVLEGPDAGLSRAAESEALTVGSAEGNDVRLSDETVSRYHLELTRVADGVRVVDCGSTNGTWLQHARIERAVVSPGSVLTIGRTRVAIERATDKLVTLHAADRFGQLRGVTALMRRLMARLEKVATSETALLLVGESGTGKELIARALHERSPRGAGPFVTFDCGALTPSLVSSALFGHERGAFTGADRRYRGAFEQAAGGTLFLDEVGELPAELQTHLLGVLERKSFRRVGGDEDIATDVRIVSATNRDLRAEVNAGSFRLDLFYRLAVVTLRVPPLRERHEDIPLLAEHFLRELGFNGVLGEVLPPAELARLCSHRWPGNVRELRNLIEAKLVIGDSLLAPSVAPRATEPRAAALLMGSGAPEPHAAEATALELPYKEARQRVLDDFEARYLPRLLERCEENVAKAARVANMDRSHLFTLLRRHGLR